MGDCMRSCKRSAETAEMEASSTSFSLSKRRKTVDSRELQEFELTSPDIELENPHFLSNSQDKPITVATSSNSGGVLAGDMCSSFCSGESSASRCSSNESCDIVNDSLRFVDLEVNFEFPFRFSFAFFCFTVWLLRKKERRKWTKWKPLYSSKDCRFAWALIDRF